MLVFAVAAALWVFANNALAIRNGTEPVIEISTPTAPPPEELPEPVPLAPPDTTVPVRPTQAPETGGGPAPQQEEVESSSAHRSTLPPPPFNRDCLIVNLGLDVETPMREVACLLKSQFRDINLILGVGPRSEDGSGHEDGLAVDLFVQDDEQIEEIKDCAARRFREWNLRNVIHGDQILTEAGGRFRAMTDREKPGGPDYVHLALKDERAIPQYSLTC